MYSLAVPWVGAIVGFVSCGYSCTVKNTDTRIVMGPKRVKAKFLVLAGGDRSDGALLLPCGWYTRRMMQPNLKSPLDRYM